MVRVPVPPRIAAARTASLEELLSRLESYERKISTLASTGIKLSYTSGKIESGSLQEYRSAPGYILLKRPDSLRLNIQNPLTKTSIAELASRGDEFFVWYPRDNKLFVGRNSVRDMVADSGSGEAPVFSARPIHIFEALAMRGTGSDSDLQVALEEDQDAGAKYYVIAVFRESGPGRLTSVRRIWFERSELNVVRQQTFLEGGAISSIVTYGRFVDQEGVSLPLVVRIERPADGYTLDLEFRSWRLNPDLPSEAFVLTPPESAKKVHLKEKGN